MGPGRAVWRHTRISLLLDLEPVVSAAGTIALLGEHLTPAMITGGALTLARGRHGRLPRTSVT